MDSGRCTSCGFLAFHVLARMVGPTYLEVEKRHRVSGNIPNITPEGDERLELVCLREAADLLTEIAHEQANPVAVQNILGRDRNCESWYPWTQGWSPGKHLEEYRTLELETKRQEFERRLEKDRRDWEYQLEQDRRTFEQDLSDRNRKMQERTERVGIWLAIAAVIFAFAQVIAAVISLTGDSWVVRLFQGNP